MYKKTIISFLFFLVLSLFFIFQSISKEPSDIIILKEKGLEKSQLQSLSNKFLDQAVFKRKNEIKSCTKNKKIFGRLVLEMIVSQSGSNQIRFIESDLDDVGSIQCIIFLLEKIKFPTFKGSQIFRTYTIQFVSKN